MTKRLILLMALLAAAAAAQVWTQQGLKMTGSASQVDQGSSVSISSDGNTYVSSGYGGAWVWTRSGTTWTQQGSKLAPGGAITSAAISSDGNTIIIGDTANDTSGAAYVYVRNAGVWTYQTVLVGSGAIGNAQQGVSVALSGDGNTAVIGGCYDNTYKGTIWIWTRSGTTWTQQGSKLVGSGAVGSLPQQGFSVSLSTDGNTVAEAGSGDGPTYDQGAIWVWTRSGSTWTQQGSKIVGSGYLRSQQGSVALSGNGNTLIIGGYTAGTNNQGAIWFFTRSGGVWTQQAGPLTGTVSATGQYQGAAVGLSYDGNTAIESGWGNNSNVGAAWFWKRTGSTWAQQGNLVSGSDVIGTAQQGGFHAAAISGDGLTAVVGGSNDNSAVGASWVWVSGPAFVPNTRRVILVN